MSTPPNTIIHQADVSRKLHLFLEKEWGEVVEDNALLLKELLGKYPTYEELQKEAWKIQLLLEEKKKELDEKNITKKWLEKDEIDIPEKLAKKIEEIESTIQILTDKKKLIEENILLQIATAHYTTLDTIHTSSLEKNQLDEVVEKNTARLWAIKEELENNNNLREVVSNQEQELLDNKAKILELLTKDGIEAQLITSLTQAYELKIQEKAQEKEKHTQANILLEKEQTTLTDQIEEITKKLQTMEAETYDQELHSQLERFLGKEKLQQHQQWEQELAPTLQEIMRKRPSSYNSKLLEHLTDTSRFQSPKYDQEEIRWFREALKKLEELYPTIPEQARMQFLLAQITPGTTNSLLNKSLKATNPVVQEYIKKIEEQKKERAQLDAFAEQFTSREKWYTDEGKEKIKSALWYTWDENHEFYFLHENWREQARRVPFATIDNAIQKSLREIQDCLASGYVYNEQYWYSFSANYTEKIKLLTAITKWLTDADTHNDTDKIREFMKEIIKATWSEVWDEQKEWSYHFPFYKHGEKPVKTLPSKNTLTHLETQVGEFSTKTEALLNSYYTDLPQINNRLIRTQDSNTTYPLPKSLWITDIRNTTDTWSSGQKTPSQLIRTSYTSLGDHTRYIEKYTTNIARYEQERTALFACIQQLNNPPKAGLVIKSIDSAALISLINNIPNIQTAFSNNNITLIDKLDEKNIPQYVSMLSQKISNLAWKIDNDESSKTTSMEHQTDALTNLNTTEFYLAYYWNAFDTYVLQLKKAEMCAYSSDQVSKTPDENFPIYLQHKAQIEQDKKEMLEKITTFLLENTCTLENYTKWRKEFDNLYLTTGKWLDAYTKVLQEDSKVAEKEHEAFTQNKEQLMKASESVAQQLKRHIEEYK